MPNTYQFAQQNQWFSNHVSGSNGTRSGVFSLFFGLSCYYWESFDPAHIQPVFIKRLQELGYEIQTYPSATFADPPFGRVIFGGVPGIHTETKGKTSLERDTRIAEEFISDSQQHKKRKKPFFSFLFFDLPHSFELPARQEQAFPASLGVCRLYQAQQQDRIHSFLESLSQLLLSGRPSAGPHLRDPEEGGTDG